MIKLMRLIEGGYMFKRDDYVLCDRYKDGNPCKDGWFVVEVDNFLYLDCRKLTYRFM